MDLQNDFSDIVTTIDNLKSKISNQEYIEIMKSLKKIYESKSNCVKEVICKECLLECESDNYSDSDSDIM